MAQGKKSKATAGGTGKWKGKKKAGEVESEQAKIDIEKTFAEEEKEAKKEATFSQLSETPQSASGVTSSEVGGISYESKEQSSGGIFNSILQLTGPIQEKIKPLKERFDANIQMAKNMYSMFQGMRQMYGGDTKKTLGVIFGFAKEEMKRRVGEFRNRIKEKVKEKLLMK